jgi:tripartite-type tricarboxylate transporter receptor subunit TctC
MTGFLRAAMPGLVCMLGLAGAAAPASAADYPNRPVRWLMGFAADGPVDTVDTLDKAAGEALKDPKLAARLAEVGGIPKPMTPAEFGKLIADVSPGKLVEFPVPSCFNRPNS